MVWIHLCTNFICTLLCLSTYTTVIFNGMSLWKRVTQLALCGLKSLLITGPQITAFPPTINKIPLVLLLPYLSSALLESTYPYKIASKSSKHNAFLMVKPSWKLIKQLRYLHQCTKLKPKKCQMQWWQPSLVTQRCYVVT